MKLKIISLFFFSLVASLGESGPVERKPLLVAKLRPYIGMPSKDFAQFDATTLSAKVPYYVIDSNIKNIDSTYVLVFGGAAKDFEEKELKYPLMEWQFASESFMDVENINVIGIVEFRKGKEFSAQYLIGVSPVKLITFAKKILEESGYQIK